MFHLIPYPGPQVMPVTVTLMDPSPIETQSSPVAIMLPIMLTASDRSTWTPSELRTSWGDAILMLRTVTLWESLMKMWKPIALTDWSPSMIPLVILLNLIVCTKKQDKLFFKEFLAHGGFVHVIQSCNFLCR